MLSTAMDDERFLELAPEDNARDLRRCRELLVELDEDDLRSRLSAGTWDARSGGQRSQREVDMQSGLQVTSTRRMRREQVVDAVVLKVRRVRAELGQKNPAPDCLP